jgi:type II secretory pathway pseudopilin PulG
MRRGTRRNSGFTYIALIAIIAIMGICLGAAGKYWSFVMLRDREAELLFRGDQYRLAIERYYLAIPGRTQYPQSIEDLLKDSRSPNPKHHLRKKYLDPFTGEDFLEIRDPTSKRLIGVKSADVQMPLRQADFPAPYETFASKTRHTDWEFVTSIKAGGQAVQKPQAGKQ